MKIKKKIYFNYINGTGYEYENYVEIIDYIINVFRKLNKFTITNNNQFEIEMNDIIGNSNYVVYCFDKNIINDIEKEVNIMVKDRKELPSLKEYLNKIDNDTMTILIEECDMNYYKHKKIENTMTIYSYNTDSKQNEARNFLNDIQKYYILESYYYPHKFIFNKNDNSTNKCKYCIRENPVFDDRSHLISRFLKNYKYFDSQECHDCNQDFGRTIEISASHFFQQLLNYNLNKDSYSINMQNVYRLLAKMSMGFLDVSYTTSNLKNTIEWIKCEKSYKSLPKVLLFIDKNGKKMDDEPIIFSFFKNSNCNDIKLPFMYSILSVDKYSLLYIIPRFVSETEEKDFSIKENFKYFFDIITLTEKKFRETKEFKLIDFSCDKNQNNVNIKDYLLDI